MVCFCLAGEPPEKDLPAGGAAPQWDAAEGWIGTEVQVHLYKGYLFIQKEEAALKFRADMMQILWFHRWAAKQTKDRVDICLK